MFLFRTRWKVFCVGYNKICLETNIKATPEAQPSNISHPHEPEELESLDSEESEPESKSWKGNCHGTIGPILLTSHWNCFSWLFSASSPSSPIFWRPISIIVPLFFLGNLKVQISTPMCAKWSNVHTILVSCILGLVSKYVSLSGIFINTVVLQSSCGFPLITKHPYASLVHCPNNTSYIILPSSMPSSAAPWHVSAAWIPNESPRWCSPLIIHLEGRYLRPRGFGWILAFPKFVERASWKHKNRQG